MSDIVPKALRGLHMTIIRWAHAPPEVLALIEGQWTRTGLPTTCPVERLAGRTVRFTVAPGTGAVTTAGQALPTAPGTTLVGVPDDLGGYGARAPCRMAPLRSCPRDGRPSASWTRCFGVPSAHRHRP